MPPRVIKDDNQHLNYTLLYERIYYWTVKHEKEKYCDQKYLCTLSNAETNYTGHVTRAIFTTAVTNLF